MKYPYKFKNLRNKNINHVFINYKSNKSTTVLRFSTFFIKLLRKFIFLGLLQNFLIFNFRNYKIIKCYFNFFKGLKFFKRIKTMSPISRKNYLTLDSLKLIDSKIYNSIMLLRTSHGILTHKESILKGTGGVAVMFLAC